MEILAQLGIDKTLWIQLGFFMVSYYFLSQFLFKPYLKNLEYRKKNTSGASDEAVKLMAKTEGLAVEYEGKMKNNNEKAIHLFNQIKNEGKAEEQKVVVAARAKAEKVIAEANDQISKELQAVRKQIEQGIPEMSKSTASKLLGREL